MDNVNFKGDYLPPATELFQIGMRSVDVVLKGDTSSSGSVVEGKPDVLMVNKAHDFQMGKKISGRSCANQRSEVKSPIGQPLTGDTRSVAHFQEELLEKLDWRSDIDVREYTPNNFASVLEKVSKQYLCSSGVDSVDEKLKEILSVIRKISVTSEDIGRVFAWDEEMNASQTEQYRNMLLNLADTETGKALIRNIVALFLCNIGLPSVKFIHNSDKESKCDWREGQEPVQINIRLDPDEFVFILSRDQTMEFVGAEVPPCCLMAHELGHVLLRLLMRRNLLWEDVEEEYARKWLKTTGERLLKAKGMDCAFLGEDSSLKQAAIGSLSDRVRIDHVKLYEQGWYQELFEKVVEVTKAQCEFSSIKLAFIDRWNHGKYGEVINILPVAKILKRDENLLCYSDGRMVKELWDKRQKVEFFEILPSSLGKENTTASGADKCRHVVKVNFPEIDARDSLVRFGHDGVDDFSDEYGNLSVEEQKEFKTLTLKLLNKVHGRDPESDIDLSVLPTLECVTPTPHVLKTPYLDESSNSPSEESDDYRPSGSKRPRKGARSPSNKKLRQTLPKGRRKAVRRISNQGSVFRLWV